MAYLQKAATQAVAILEELAVFAVNNGWTVHRSEAVGDDYVLTLSANGGAYVTLYADLAGNYIYINGHRALDTGAAWNAQPDQYYQSGDAEMQSRVDLRVTPLTSVHMFGGLTPTPYLYLAIELQPGYYRHIVLGYLQKFGTALGGLFWDIADTEGRDSSWSSYSQYNRYPLVYNTFRNSSQRKGGVDAQTAAGVAEWYSFGYEGAVATDLYAGHQGVEFHTQRFAGVNAFNGRTILQAPFILLRESGLTPFGTPPNLRYVMLDYYEAGDEITLGADVWKVFPMIRRGAATKSTGATEPSDEGSDMYGIAYLKG